MIDPKTLEAELQEARRARLEAQSAGLGLEALVGQMRSGRTLEQIELEEAQENGAQD